MWTKENRIIRKILNLLQIIKIYCIIYLTIISYCYNRTNYNNSKQKIIKIIKDKLEKRSNPKKLFQI